MLATILNWLVKSKGAKVGAGALSGASLVALLLGASAQINSRFEKQEARQKEYVTLSLKPIEIEIKYIRQAQKETKSMVRDIHNLLLKSKTK